MAFSKGIGSIFLRVFYVSIFLCLLGGWWFGVFLAKGKLENRGGEGLVLLIL